MRRKIIDMHTHTFPDQIAARAVASLQGKSHTAAFSDGTVTGLAERNDLAGIDYTVVLPVATSAGQVEHINDRAARQNQLYDRRGEDGPKGIVSFAGIHPDCAQVDQLCRQIKAQGFLGVKLHPVYQSSPIDGTATLRILAACAEEDLLVVTHAGWDIGFPGADQCMPKRIRRALRMVDPEGGHLRFVAAHMGGWRAWQEACEELSDLDIYIDTSFSTGSFVPNGDGFYDGKDVSMLDAEAFLTVMRAFGEERVLFGTDNPWSDAKACIRFIEALPIGETEKENIFCQNARTLLRI